MLICEKCGELYEESEVNEDNPYCGCGGEIVTARHCKLCGDYTPSSGHGYCKHCFEDLKDFDTLFEFCEEDKKRDEINGFVLSFFTAKEIENILLAVIKNSGVNIKEGIDRFANDWKLELCEWHLKKVSKGERK